MSQFKKSCFKTTPSINSQKTRQSSCQAGGLGIPITKKALIAQSASPETTAFSISIQGKTPLGNILKHKQFSLQNINSYMLNLSCSLYILE